MFEGIESLVSEIRKAAPLSERAGEICDIPVAITDKEQRVRVLTEVMEVERKLQPAPARRQGMSWHTELPSFIQHLNRYGSPSCTVWCSTDDTSMLAVYNYNPPGPQLDLAGWHDHYAKFEAKISPELKKWREFDDMPMQTEQFSDFIEEYRHHFAPGTDDSAGALEMIEVTRNLQIKTKGTFIKRVNPNTGEYHAVASEEQTGEGTRIPQKFALQLRVFEGEHAYRMEALVRFKIRDGIPWFSFILQRVDEIIAKAFEEMTTQVAEETGYDVYMGSPESLTR